MKETPRRKEHKTVINSPSQQLILYLNGMLLKEEGNQGVWIWCLDSGGVWSQTTIQLSNILHLSNTSLNSKNEDNPSKSSKDDSKILSKVFENMQINSNNKTIQQIKKNNIDDVNEEQDELEIPDVEF
ncbi:hypothetical protein C1645_834577 [Glomus cerebriforme]|uniref:Uncharacterized protein n=1 Tax=Glomus cerebriforme TaxID=658196 RepID=A0A397S9F7_9GLOM|nr:hypothetical protein C1645_834577 [Glomus cerebriforme]